MDFNHSDDRRMLADTLGRFVAAHSDPLGRMELARTVPGYDPALWTQYAELGIIGALFAPEQGGFGGTGFDIMLVFEELGRGLVPEPFLSALMSGRTLAAADGQSEHIAALIGATSVIAFAHQEAEGGCDVAGLNTRAERIGEKWVLTGTKAVIRDAEEAAALLVSARTSESPGGGASLFLVPAGTDGLALNGYSCIDGGRAAEVTLEGVELPLSALVGAEGDASGLLAEGVDAGIVALCSEALGLMSVVRDATLDYLRTRVQFGEPIGRNQALQHRMAALLIEIEQARSAVINAAAALAEPADQRARAISAAKYTVGKTGTLVAEEAIQLHGGIGMTWELPMTHYAKRLLMINHQLGDEDYHLMRYVALGRAA